MGKLSIATLLATVAISASAATLTWGYAAVGPDTYVSPSTSVLDGSSARCYSFWTHFDYGAEHGDSFGIGGWLGVTDDEQLVAVNGSIYGAAYGVALVLADVGDVVDYESTALSPALMKYGIIPSHEEDVADEWDGTFTGDYAADLSDGRTAYLGFAQHNMMGPGGSYLDGTPPYYYGWMRVGLEDGNLKIYEVAVDLTGSPVRIVAIPEPSAAGLVALGTAMLALRRHART